MADEPTSISTQVKYCQDHYDQLMFALVERNMADHLSKSPEELVEKLQNDQMDAGLEASSAITTAALELFGPDAILSAGGCPVCTFGNIITHVADHMAVKYTKSN